MMHVVTCRPRTGRLRVALVLGMLGLGLVACGGATTTATSHPSTTTTTTDSSVTIGIVCSTPTDAATSLVNAWKAGDRAAAARCAMGDVVSQLFKVRTDTTGWSFAGCGGSDPGVPVCSFLFSKGSATLTIEGTEARGWKVTKLQLMSR